MERGGAHGPVRAASRPWLLGHYDYPVSFRVLEVAGLIGCVAMGTLLLRRLVLAFDALPSLGEATALAAVALAAFVTGDLLSGLVHFLCDNLGSPDTPVIGQKFILPFREHHDDPTAMTEGDFVAVNADNFLVCLPVLVPAVLWLDIERHRWLASFLAVLTIVVIVTNELHKQVHLAEPARLARGLQRTGLVLTPQRHQRHHTEPYDTHYCIVSGVLEPLMTRIGFWPRLLRTCHRLGLR